MFVKLLRKLKVGISFYNAIHRLLSSGTRVEHLMQGLVVLCIEFIQDRFILASFSSGCNRDHRVKGLARKGIRID